MAADLINQPPHYMAVAIQSIELVENYSFLLGNAIKYILRAPYKGQEALDYGKAVFYLKRIQDKPDQWKPLKTDKIFITTLHAFQARHELLELLLDDDGCMNEDRLLMVIDSIERFQLHD